jgi:hypothetical protein
MSGHCRIAILICFIAIPFGDRSLSYSADQPGESAKTALRKKGFPWYDATKDGYKSLKPNKPADLPEYRVPKVSIPFIQILLWIVLGIIVALMLAALVQWLRNNVSPPVKETVAAPVAAVSVEQLEALPQSTRGVRDLLGEADRLAGIGAYGQAMTFYHSWQLTQLDRHGMIELQKGKTNRQYIVEIKRSSPELVGLFRNSIRLFEDAFFGHLEITREAFEEVWKQRTQFERVRPSE